MKVKIVVVALVTWLWASIDKFGFAADENSFETGTTAYAHWKYLISGWRSERQKLTSYEVRVKGHEQLYAEFAPAPPHALSKPTTLRKVDLRIVRDDSGPRLRTEVRWGDGGQSAGTWIRASDHVAEWVRDEFSPVVLIAPTSERQYFAIKFQPEAAGIFGAGDFRYYKNEDLLILGYDYLLDEKALVSTRSLGDGRYESRLRHRVGKTERFRDQYIIINEKKGFAAERRTYTSLGPADATDKPVDGELNVTWSKKGELWLPFRLTETRRSGLATVDLTFDWVSVNGPIQPSEFDLNSLGAPHGSTVVDQRLGREKPIILGQTGNPVQIPEMKLPAPFLRPSTVVLLAVGACLLTLAVWGLLLAWRRGRKTRSIDGARS